MPIYEYLCTDGHRIDVVQKFADEALTKCEVCGRPAQRVLYAPAVHFKGKGFYATDYGKGKAANGDRAETGSSSDSKEAAASSSGGNSDGNSSSKSESNGSGSKGSDSKSSDSKSSGGDSSSSKKADSKAASS
jgi:putative FmdB family regulatory protein